MALDTNLKVVTSRSINVGLGTSDNSPTFDFSTSLAGSGDKTPFPEGSALVVVVETLAAAGNLPIRCDFEITIDGTNFRKVASVTFTQVARKEVKSVRFGLLDWVPDAATAVGSDRTAAPNLGCRVVVNYTTSAGTFVYSAFLAGPHQQPAFNA